MMIPTNPELRVDASEQKQAQTDKTLLLSCVCRRFNTFMVVAMATEHLRCCK